MTSFFVVSKLALIIISCLFSERAIVHQHPQTYRFMHMAEQQWILLLLSPQDLPPVQVVALITPTSDLFYSVSSLVWLWMWSPCGYWWQIGLTSGFYTWEMQSGERMGKGKQGGREDGRNTERLLERVTIIPIS